MSRDDAPGRHRAYRHLLTAARGGFQTVAAAAGLPAALVAQLEQEVGSFALPDGDGGHPSLQLRRWDDDFHLLTRFAPRDGGGDGRRGNYLAESLLVPTAWLAEADWDAAAAFAAGAWRGTAGLDALAAGAGAAELPDEPLPPLAPGRLDRLAALAERAPGDLLDHLLLGLVGWAARGERLTVVEARAERPAEIEQTILLLPLALPPSCRAGRRSGKLRGVELRTRGPARGMPPVDLAGVAAGDLDRAAAAGGTVIDLGGRLPLDAAPDLEGYDYAQWAKAAIRDGRWEEMAAVFARAAEVPAEELFRRFGELSRRWREEGSGGTAATPARGAARPVASPARPPKAARAAAPPPAAPPPVDDLPGDALPAPVETRRARWQARRDLESAAARGHDAWRGEVEALVGALEDENRRAAEELREELAAVGERIAARLRTEREALWEETVRTLEAAAVESQKRFHADVERLLEKARGETDAALRELRRETGRRERRLASGEPAAAGAGAGRSWRRRAGGIDGRKVAAVAAGVAVSALLGWLAWRAWGPARAAADDPAAGASRGAPTREERALLPRLQDAATARALLLRAREAEGLAEPAATTALALLLADAPAPSAAERCLLLQAALHRRGFGPSGRPLTVDGACGAGTAATLGDATAGSCCAELPAPAGGAPPADRAACFLGATFALAEAERCAGADPFAPGRGWTGTEAANLLALLRYTAENAAAGVRPEAERLRARHDLAASAAVADRAADAPVTDDEAALLLDLARALAGGGPGSEAGDDEVAALLDALGPPAGAPASPGG